MAKIVKHKSGAQAVLYIRVPAELSNEIKRIAKKESKSVNHWVANHLMSILAEKKRLPKPSNPATVQEILEGKLTGIPPLEPCGDAYPCRRTGSVEIDGWEWCNECRIRLF